MLDRIVAACLGGSQYTNVRFVGTKTRYFALRFQLRFLLLLSAELALGWLIWGRQQLIGFICSTLYLLHDKQVRSHGNSREPLIVVKKHGYLPSASNLK